MGRGVTPLVLVLHALAGCRQILGLGDTEVVVSDAPTSGDGAQAIDADPAAPDARVDDPPGGDAPPGIDAMATCPASYTVVGAGATRYRTSGGQTTWSIAAADCADDGVATYLAIPDDMLENELLAPLANNEAWIGVSDVAVEGTWMNVLGQPQTFFNWESSEPDMTSIQNCVTMRDDSDNGAWYDNSCTVNRRFFCECP